ncbi:MAG: zinc-binding dehydrogenase [Chitinophagaceae bacterium]|nr:zinc-binding dehydrogenase [Chitinophagaceae bacterium]
MKTIGADKVIDYTKEDFTQNGESYDVIIDTVNTISVSRSLQSLSKNGGMILSAAGMPEMIQGKWISATGSRNVLMGVISHMKADLEVLKKLMETGKYKAVIDKAYSLSQIAEAHAYVEKGHKKGNVAIEL